MIYLSMVVPSFCHFVPISVVFKTLEVPVHVRPREDANSVLLHDLHVALGNDLHFTLKVNFEVKYLDSELN